MARDKKGNLIPRSHHTQDTFNRHVRQIQDRWGVEPLQAIPDVRGLRPTDADELGVDHLRFLYLISKLESKLVIVSRDMIAERDARILIKPPTCASDRTLKPGDLRRLLEKYRSRNKSGGAKSVAVEIECPLITLEPEVNTTPFTSKPSALTVLENSYPDPSSPRMLTRFSRKRKYGLDNATSFPTTKKTFHAAKPSEPLKVAVTNATSDQKNIDKHSIPISHQCIETSPTLRVNPVRLQVDRLRTSCGDMMFMIEGIARSWKLEPLTMSQKEELAYDSEVCETAMKKLLDAYLQKLEGAGIIPRILYGLQSSTHVSNGSGDAGADLVGLAGHTDTTSSHPQIGMAETSA